MFTPASRYAVALATALLVLNLSACNGNSEGEGEQMPDTEITERELTEQELTEERELTTSDTAVAFETTVDGHTLYRRNCAVCHGNDGDGNLGPALTGNRNLASSTYTVARIQLGGGGMPPFARLLSGEEIAAVASFIRSDLGNEFGPIDPQQVELQWNGYERGMRYGVFNLPGGG